MLKRIWEAVGPFIRWVLLAILVFAAILLLVRILGVQPPQEFTIATGREGGAYYAFAQQYKERLAEEGYTLKIRQTAGSRETIALVAAGEVDAGFVQNTTYADAAYENVMALAGLFNEALWIFYRQDFGTTPEYLSDLQGLRIGIGEEGSGTQSAALALLNESGVTAQNTTFDTSPGSGAAQLLKEGRLDAMMVVSGANSPLVNDLLETPGIDLISLRRAKAFTSRYKNFSSMVLGEGTIDLSRNIPSEDKQLLTTTATLVANSNLHPDLARLLLIIATEIHSEGGILEGSGEFPAPVYAGVPMNPDAVRFLENGPTGLERYLPLWMASRIERLFFLLIPIALILYPLFRGAPSALAYANRYRVKRRYRYLRNLEQEYRTYDVERLGEAIERLESFQQDLNEHVSVPTTMLDEYYELRMHTGLTLDRLQARKASLQKAVQT